MLYWKILIRLLFHGKSFSCKLTADFTGKRRHMRQKWFFLVLLLGISFFQGCTKLGDYYGWPLGFLHYEYDEYHSEESQLDRLEKK